MKQKLTDEQLSFAVGGLSTPLDDSSVINKPAKRYRSPLTTNNDETEEPLKEPTT